MEKRRDIIIRNWWKHELDKQIRDHMKRGYKLIDRGCAGPEGYGCWAKLRYIGDEHDDRKIDTGESEAGVAYRAPLPPAADDRH